VTGVALTGLKVVKVASGKKEEDEGRRMTSHTMI